MKKVLAIIYVVILIISGILAFYEVPELNIVLSTYQIKGAYVVICTSLVYAFSVFTNKKTATFISLILTVFGYGYTIYTIDKLDMSLSEFSIGCYLYFGAIIALVLSLVIPNDSLENSDVNTTNSDEQLEQIQTEGSYILCSYVSGVKNVTDIYKSPSVLIIKPDTNALSINIKAPEEIKFLINDTNIQKIVLTKTMIVNYSESKLEDYTVETQYLASVLAGSFGALIGEKIAKNNGRDSKVNLNANYKIEILYTEGEEKRLVFQTRENPTDFFEKYKNIMEIK